MNKRIKELAAKSNFGHMENGEVVYDHRLEKFAELIVQECAEWVNDNVGLIDEEARADLLKHFGIKE